MLTTSHRHAHLPGRSRAASVAATAGWLFASFALVAAGCGSDTEGNNAGSATKTYGLPSGVLKTLTSVNTSLSKSEILAGESVQVGCVGDPGSVPIPSPEFEVGTAAGWTRDGAVLTVTAVGTYAIACTLHDGKVKDDSPAQLVVKAAKAVKVSATVEPTKIGAGAKATVSCHGEDKFGNPIAAEAEGWSVKVEPSTAGKVSGMVIEGEKAGKADVSCRLESAPDAPSTPASLEIIPGAPGKTKATVNPTSIVAGDSKGAEVGCSVEDAHGNAIATAEATVDVPADVKLTGKAVTSSKSGTHEITCSVAGTKLTKEAAKLKVTPAEAKEWELETKNPQKIYKAGDNIVLVGRGKDVFGNEILNMKTSAPATYDPVDLVGENKVDGVTKSYKLISDGNFTFTTKLDGETYGALADSLGPRTLKLKADSTGPLVLITEPKRGATLNGNAKVNVKGMVIDELSALKEFKVGGQPVQVGPDGSFAFDVDSQQGMNPIIWTASDEWDNASAGVQTWYYSTLWLPAAATPVENAMVKEGIGIWLSQSVIDSGKHDHTAPKDIATVAEIILGTLDFGALIGGAAGGGGAGGYLLVIDQKTPGFHWTGGAKLANVKMGDKAFNSGYPEVSLTVIDGGMHMAAKIHSFSADLVVEVQSELDPNPLKLKPTKFNQTATMTAKTIELSMDLMLSLDPKTGKIASEAKNVDLNLVDFKIQLSGVLGFLTNWLLDATKTVLEGAIELIAKSTLNSLIGGQLSSLLDALAINTSLDLGPFIGAGEPTTLNLNTKVGQLIFKPTKAQAGGIILALDAAATSKQKVDHAVLGSIGRAACLKAGAKEIFNPGLKFPIEAGLRDDFVNELLFALWYGGLLQLDIGADALGGFDMTSFGVTDLSVKTDFMLPPILNTCYGGQDLKLQIGDLHLNAKLKLNGTPIDIWLYGTLQATASLDAVKNKDTGAMEIGFALKGIDFLELEIEKINEEGKDLKDVFLSLIKTLLLPKLTEGLGSGLGSFPLPELDLSSFSPQIPKGTVLKLSIQQIETVAGFTYIRGLFQ